MGRRVVHWREYEVEGVMMGGGYRGVGSNRGGEGVGQRLLGSEQ